MKKIVSILLALALILALGTTAFAADTEYFQLTIEGIKDHSYKVFQIYTGDVYKDVNGELVISNVKYGQNHYPVDGEEGDNVPDSDLKDFMNSVDPANYFKSQIRGDAYATVNTDGKQNSVTITVAAGYYLIVDVTANLPEGQTKSPVLLKIAETTTIASKHASITSEKKVDDKNDSNNTEDNINWVDSADYDFGDDVPFKLSVGLPTTMSTYETYELTFHDNQDAGFAYPENFKAYIVDANGNTKLEISKVDSGDGFTVAQCTSDACEFGGCTFTVRVGDIKKIYKQNNKTFANGDQVVVTYTSELKDTANVGRAGNENGMYVCHPDGHTPEDFVTVLTYELKIKKVDGSDNLLPGAGFTLYKWSAAKNDWEPVGGEIGGEGSTVTEFTWSGIDGGVYKLVETTTPDGYNSVADMEFTIDSNHKDEWIKGGNTAFLDVIAKDANGKVVFADAKTEGEILVEDGILEGNVVNHKGVVLPQTGAKGTIMLIGTSSLLVLVAAVFMVTRKKMSIYED